MTRIYSYLILLVILNCIPDKLSALQGHAKKGNDTVSITFIPLEVGDSNTKNKSVRLTVYISEFPYFPLMMVNLEMLVKKDIICTEGKAENVVFKSPGTYSYMWIQAKFDQHTISPFYKITNTYILGQGDDIQVKLFRDHASFEGNGAYRLNCLSDIFAIHIDEETYPSLVNAHLFKSAVTWEKNAYDSVLSKRQAVLAHYKNKLARREFELLGCTTISLVYFEYFYSIRILLSTQGVDSEWSKMALSNYYNNFSMGNIREFNKFGEAIKQVSPLYSAFLLEKMNLDILASMVHCDNIKTLDFRPYFLNILRLPKGELRDQTMALSFFVFKRTRNNSILYLDSAIHNIESWRYRKLLLDLGQKEQEGKDFFNFSLIDSSGQHFTLKDIKGKFAIIDFWYSGCENCILLKKAMEPVFKKYQDNPKVIFVSVSVDNSMESWKKSLKKGLYTDSCETNLLTNRLGVGDSLIKYYKIAAFPRQYFVLDGKMLNANPPNPINTKIYYDLIESAIKKL